MPVGSLNYVTSDIEWQIPQFSSLAKSKWQSSPSFNFRGQTWYLEISIGDRISVSIVRETLASPINVDIAASLKNSRGEKECEKYFRKNFSNKLTNKTSSGMVTLLHNSVSVTLMQTSDLLRRGWELLPHDVLTVACTLKMVEYAENEKAAPAPEIIKLSHYSAPATGEQEVILLCGQVNKYDIEIVFYEENEKRERIWSDTGKLSPDDVHRETAISFKTPPYKTTNIRKEIECFICLRRPSDKITGNSRKFIFFPPRKGHLRTPESSVDENEILAA